MPFPWKKVKSNKISQLFSDHLESHRRQRGHLVVETGFPTSLVDLFVKNLDRLKKPKSSKKKKRKKKNDQNIENSSVLPSPSPSSSPLNIPRAPCSSPFVLNPGVSSLSSFAINGGSIETHERPNAKGTLGAILGMFFVVVVALWAKKFAVGLLMSALLLFFMEFIGKKSYRFVLKPCSGAKRRLSLIMQSSFQLIRFRNKSFVDDQKFNSDTGSKEDKLGCNDDHGGGSVGKPNCKIQIAAEPTMVFDYGCVGSIQEPPLDQPSCGGGGNNKEEECEPPKKGKRAKMKSKIKRLLPRKLRGGRSKKEKSSHLETGKNPTINEEEEEEEEETVQSQNGQSITSSRSTSTTITSTRTSTSTSTTTQEGNDEISTISNSDEDDGINVTGEEEEEQEEEVRKLKESFVCFVTFGVVLVGVTFWDKYFAMVLVISWFLILKSLRIFRKMIK